MTQYALVGDELGFLRACSLTPLTYDLDNKREISHNISYTLCKTSISQPNPVVDLLSLSQKPFSNSVGNEITSFIAGFKDGSISKYNVGLNDEAQLEIKLEKNLANVAGLQKLAGISTGTGNGTKIFCCGIEDAGIVDVNGGKLERIELKGPIEACESNLNGTLVGLGGRNRDLRIWDVEKGNYGFIAMNVPRNFLDMVVPIWVTGVDFITDNELVTCTGYGQVRMYDTKASKQPILDLESRKYKEMEPFGHLKAIKYLRECHSVIIGDHTGLMASFDLRTGRMVGLFEENVGGIRSLDLNENDQLLSGGLDRVVRLYNAKKGLKRHQRLVSQLYVKQRITKVLHAPWIAPLAKLVKDVDDKDGDDEPTDSQSRDDDSMSEDEGSWSEGGEDEESESDFSMNFDDN